MLRAVRWRALAPLLQVAVLLALARFPPARAVFPVLGVLVGPLGVAMAVLAAGVAAARLRARPLGLPGPRVLGAVGALVLGVFAVRHASLAQATGDEIEYLLLTQSLWSEGDLDIADNYEREDYKAYTPGMGEMPWGTLRADGRPISTHSPGLPAVLAPVYALGGRTACVLVLALAAAGTVVLTHALARKATGQEEAARFAALAALGPPLFFYGAFVYTEAPSALVVAAALHVLGSTPSPRAAALAALLVSALPWLHVKLIPAAAALGAVGLLRLRGRALAAFCLVAAAMAAGFVAHFWTIFGDPTPLALYGSRVPRAVRRAEPELALAGLLADASFGLLPVAPVFLLALAGLPLLRRAGASRWPLALTGLALLLPLVSWRKWWGGFCPPARFLVPLIPLLAVLLALRLAASASGLARWRWPLFAGGVALAAYGLWNADRLLVLNTKDEPPRVLEAIGGEVGAARYLPKLTDPTREEQRVGAVWGVTVLGLLALDAAARRREPVDRWFRGLGLPVVLLLLVGSGVDGWARKRPARRSATALELSGGGSAGPASAGYPAPSTPWGCPGAS